MKISHIMFRQICTHKLVVAVLFSVMMLVAVFFYIFANESVRTEASNSVQHTLVIDAGHGGIDGGAISGSGVKESDLNLLIASKLRDLSAFAGIKTIMTRTDDSSFTESRGYSERGELEFRTQVINSADNPVYLGIHQNCYITPQPHGTQVLYAATDNSEVLGKLLREYITAFADTGSRAVAVPVDSKLYITSHISCPGVLVECGFMSNDGDFILLCSEIYQMRLSLAMLSAFIEFENGRLEI